MRRTKRIAAIRKKDMELVKAEQTPEAHAFLYKRTEEKFYHLESMTIQIAESKHLISIEEVSVGTAPDF